MRTNQELPQPASSLVVGRDYGGGAAFDLGGGRAGLIEEAADAEAGAAGAEVVGEVVRVGAAHCIERDFRRQHGLQGLDPDWSDKLGWKNFQAVCAGPDGA